MGNSVTVLIPCYNSVKYIGSAIDSVVSDGVRVIVADDGSTDGSREYLESRDDIDLVTLDGPHGNPTFAYNTMLQMVDTEYFIAMDADDELAPGAIPIMLAAMEGNDYDWFYTNVLIIDEYGAIVGAWDYENFPRDHDGIVEYIKMNKSNAVPIHAMLRTSFIRDNGLKWMSFETTLLGEDMRTVLDWIKHKPNIGWSYVPLYYYRIHDGGRSYSGAGLETIKMRDEVSKLIGGLDA